MIAGRELAGVRRLPCTLVVRESCGAAHGSVQLERTEHEQERCYSPVPFADVRIDGAFWRERLETVLDAHHPEPARQARRGSASSIR